MLDCRSLNAGFRTAAAVVLLTFAGALYAPAITAAEPQVEVTQLLKATHSWDGTQYGAYPQGQPEVSVLHYQIAANSSLPWHIHPVINVAYVLSGQLTVVRKRDGKTLVLGPGSVLPEMVNAVHRGRSGDEPVELVVFYAGTPNVPLTIKSENDSDD